MDKCFFVGSLNMDAQEIWQQNLLLIQKSVSPRIYNTWFKDLKVKSIKDNQLNLLVPNLFCEEWIKEKYYKLIVDNMSIVTNITDWNVSFDICKIEQKALYYEKVNSNDDNKKPVKKIKRNGLNSHLNSKLNFDNFVVGSCNQFAHAASLAVVKCPGKSYNPLFIYGGVGLGKTHLLHAIGNMLISNSSLNVLYLSTEQFTNDLINSIRNDKMEMFRQKYRNIDVLLVDDIQFLAGKERTQEEFFYTFNSLYEIDKQIVVSSDRFPKEINNIEERLRSRFEWGLIADMQIPDLETRIAILKSKSAAEDIILADDIIMFLAQNIKNNVRELEGSLTRLIAFSSLTGKDVTVELAKKILRDIIKDAGKLPTLENIQKKVSEKLHIRVSDLKSKKRTKSLIFPRQLAMYLCRTLTSLSFPDIGNGFGGKDHTTIIHACKQFQKKIDSDYAVKSLVDEFITELKN